MPQIHEKPQELIAAQVAAFAAEGVDEYRDSAHIRHNVGTISLGGVEDVTRTLQDPEHHSTGVEDERIRLPEGTVRTAAKGADYVEFLRSVGGSNYEAIKTRAVLTGNYGHFQPAVRKILSELPDFSGREDHPNFLGAGSNTRVFFITEGNKKYAIRVPNSNKPSPAAIDSHLAGAVLGKGIPHLEQIVAASYEDGVTVAEIMPGKEMGNLDPEDVSKVTDEQLTELVDTLQTANSRGIEIDPKPSNLFYDPEEGYGIVDYHSSRVISKNTADQPLGDVVGSIAGSLDNAGSYGRKVEITQAELERQIAVSKANLRVLERYRTIVEVKLSGNDQQVALDMIDARLKPAKASIKWRLEPDWIAEQLAKNKEREQRKAALEDQNPIDAWTNVPLDTV